jgi:hypothetical protein
MRLKYLFASLLLVLGTLKMQAQTPPAHLIEFEETTHEFGTKEHGAPTETIFKFKNTSTVPVKLTNVKASCGCTTPEWTKDEIAPGKSGEIKVSYNSQREGDFNKSISVMYNDRTDPITLFIKGHVNPKPVTATEEAHDNHEGHDHSGHDHAGHDHAAHDHAAHTPVVATQPPTNYAMPRGGLSFLTTVENVKVLSSEEEMDLEFKYKNTSSMPVKILKDKSEASADLTLTFKDEVLAPNQESSVRVRISGRQMKAAGQVDGYFSKNFAFFTDEAQSAKKELTISGNYKRVYTEEEKANSPRIQFETTTVEGGKIIEGEKYVYDFVFKNTGKTPLKILSAKASCGCTAIKPITESIAPGDSAAITATFDSKGRVGMQSKSINVTTNDIENPMIPLRFTVEVVKDPFHAGGVTGQ